MKKTSTAWWQGALMAATATFVFQGSARAQSCEADADCGAGYGCKTESYESCYNEWECNEDGECAPGDVICETYTSSWCANDNCEADADCPSFMKCQPQTTWVCEGGGMGGAGGSAGGVAGTGASGVGGAPADGGFEEPSCEEVPAPSVCIPRYDLPCETATDCGGGFDCVETYYWMCGGGGPGMGGFGGAGGAVGGTGGDGDGDGDGDGEADGGTSCEQIPSGTNACQLQDLPCESSSECPEGLECVEQYIYGECTGGMAGTGGAAGTGWGGVGGFPVDGGASDPIECPEPEIVHKCMPSAWHGGGGGGAGGVGGGMAGAGGGEVDAGVEEPGGEAGAAGTSAAGMGGGGGADEDDDSDEDGGKGRGRGWLKRLLRGCSAGGPVSSEGSMGWLMLGVAAVVLRRRMRSL